MSTLIKNIKKKYYICPMEIAIEISPQYCLFGFNFFQRDEQYNWNELNIYFFILKLQIAW
jgi:hypothetical protein